MAPINFSNERTLGVPELDALHEAYYVALARCLASDDRGLAREFDKLVNEVEQDFNSEEKWMEEVKFAFIQPHLEQHARLLSALHHAQSSAMGGDLGPAREVLCLFPDWLDFHISTMDAELARALQFADRTTSLPPAHGTRLFPDVPPSPRGGPS